MTLREEMIEAAERKKGNHTGSFVRTDGQWCMTRTPEEFKQFIEKQGFEVIDCKRTRESNAIAITKDGYRFAWNGHCTKLINMTDKEKECKVDVEVYGMMEIATFLNKDELLKMNVRYVGTDNEFSHYDIYEHNDTGEYYATTL
ncbi:MAG: hypothetical protein LBM69_00085 [Lachnospiraceae bacterium]|nr:hypothetical protein [Lachnospiraceae bacterium]